MKKNISKITILATLLAATSLATISHISAANTSNQAKEQTQNIQRILWGVPISPYTRAVMVTLNEKGIPYKLEQTLPKVLLDATKKPVPKGFNEISPAGKIPAYEETTNGKRSLDMVESSDIMNHIEKTVHQNPLRFNENENLKITEMMKYANESVATLTHAVLMENVVKPGILKQPTDKAKVNDILNHQLPPVLDHLEKQLATSGEWIAGTKKFSLADISIVSHLVTLDTAKVNLIKQIGTKRPHLLKYVKKVLARESFKKALASLK